ncbi:hypothetical protein EG329_002866 [Mollisiaceae sp. DMI_Dod_QoI]|nr:hypothetical protein EG329_002866 [Helotiales sp. DMI_Dod_QoI]
MDNEKTITHYAILIGIDNYPDKPLKSCVRDVQDIKTYLESTLKDSVQIQAITASQADREPSDPAQDPTLWPTRENVTSAFERVTSLARAGDFVYIHYSGHGTQMPTSGEFSNGSSGDLALVLLGGEEKKQVSCLWGFELADLLKAMVDNGIIITLILDCCFSASVYRRDNPNIRFLPYSIQMDSRSPSDTKKTPEITMYRDTSMQPNWLIRPDRYAILTACGPHEETMGVKFDGKSYGALSYFLLKTVECVGLTRRHGDVHGHLCARFRGSGLRHTPVLYGNRNQGFFGQVSSDITKTAIPIIVRKDDTLELQAGHTHGVEIDDQLVLYPLGCVEGDPRLQGNSVVAKIAGTRALTSDLELLGTPSIRIRTGWMASALTRFSLQRFPIRLASGLPLRDEWLTALRERSLHVHVDTDKRPFAFDVVLDNGDCQILDESGHKIDNLTSMSQDQTGVSQIGSILEHLARFRLVRDLVNEAPADSFQKSFEVQIFSNGKAFGPDFLIEIEHNAIAWLVVENKWDKDLYVFIYDLGPSWQVENANHGTYIVVTPQNNSQRDKRTRKKLQMMIPKQMREKGYRSCKDILKVFVTSQPTSFDLLELPRLGERAKTPAADRTGREGGDGEENWVALNFPIHISFQKDSGIQ